MTTIVFFRLRRGAGLAAAVVLLAAAGCSSTPNKAPVEDRSVAPRSAAIVKSGGSAAAAEAKEGTYIVKAGDTLMRIAAATGQNWRDLARWNNMENPGVLEVGQVLRVAPPAAEPAVAVASPVLPGGPPASIAPPPPPLAAPQPPADSAVELQLAWPANGPIVKPFGDNGSKGMVFGGTAGDPVYAAASGRVVIAGAQLRGYGNMIIIKHDETYLTAYAHNQKLLVKEDQTVRKGQKIAEMGSSDTDRVQLHFELRRNGKPIDPQAFLPPR